MEARMSATWKQPQAVADVTELIGDSAATRAVRELVDRVAKSNASVLITGPSGSGKEVVAQLLHGRSPRAAQPFVAVNCTAIPRELLESEIFGHEAGSFTGAVRAKRGRFEAADHGTLFLDEIGDMPGDMQVKLLRILETRIVERVGSMIGIPVDVRLVAATNVDLEAAIAASRFREDLFYRLNVVEIRLTALAERRQDIAPLLDYFAASGATSGPGSRASVAAAGRVQFTAAATAWLAEQPWRGNVRELRNFVDRAAALHPGEQIDAQLAERLMTTDRRQAVRSALVPFATGDRACDVALPEPSHDRLQQQQFPSQFASQFASPWASGETAAPATARRSVDTWLAAPLAVGTPVRHGSPLARAPVDLKALLDHIEQSYIERALDCSAGGVAESARMLGLRRTTLIEKMRRLNIQRPMAAGVMH
jgi:DNA-binding NtrC family response regulator